MVDFISSSFLRCKFRLELFKSCCIFSLNYLKQATVKGYSQHSKTKFQTKYNIGTTSISFAWSNMTRKKAEMG